MNRKQSKSITFKIARKKDLNTLEEIRAKAFQPIFDSFRNILGATIYDHAQKPVSMSKSPAFGCVWNYNFLAFTDNEGNFPNLFLHQA